MSISREGLTLLKSFEGFRPRAIALDGGRWLIGYGHTKYARPGASVTESQAELLLRHDLIPIIGELNTRIFAPLYQNQFDALAMFAFNVGLQAFRESQICARLNAGEPLAAARQMDQWRTALIDGAPVVVDALVRRRATELELFMRTPHIVRPATSRLVVPMHDLQVGAPLPRQAAPPPSAKPSSPQAPVDAASEMVLKPAPPPPPPKPPSTLRTRFYDLLRSRRRLAPAENRTIVEVQDDGWMGPIALGFGAAILATLSIWGFLSAAAANHAGAAQPILALAAAFGGVTGAALCAAASLRLVIGRSSAADPKDGARGDGP